ncbi:MAG: Wzz/FepE/Etk N-terminal domain-containing protein [Gammaproteobacteria bacterium]
MRSSDESDSRTETSDAPTGGAVGFFVPTPVGASGPSIGVRDLVAELKARKVTVLGSVLLGLVAGALVALFATPVYRVETLLAPVSNESTQGLDASLGQLGGLAQLAGLDLGQSGNTWIAYSTLESRAFLEEFVQDADLLPELFWRDWDEQEGEWSVSDPRDIPTLWDAYELLLEDVLVLDWNNTTQLLTLTIEWRDPETATDWANTLVERVNRRLSQQTITEAEKSVEYLNAELEKTSVLGLRQAIFNLIESEISAIMTANVNEEYAFRVIDPAAPPDADDYVWPRPIITVLTGFAFGICLALAIAVVGILWSTEANDTESRAS